MNEHQELAIRALNRLRGDDLERTRFALSRAKPEEKDDFIKRIQILEQIDRSINDAIKWVVQQDPPIAYTDEGKPPISPQTGQPYFEIPKEGWGTGWTADKEIEIEL